MHLAKVRADPHMLCASKSLRMRRGRYDVEGEEGTQRRAALSLISRVAVASLETVNVVGHTEPTAWKQAVCCGRSANSGEHRSGQRGPECGERRDVSLPSSFGRCADWAFPSRVSDGPLRHRKERADKWQPTD